MSNDYYTHGPRLEPNTLARAEDSNANFEQIQAAFDRLPDERALKEGRVTFAAVTAFGNAYSADLPHPPDGYGAGLSLAFIVPADNTGPATLDVRDGNGVPLGPVALKRHDGQALLPGDLTAGQAALAVHSGTDFILAGQHGGEAALARAWASQAAGTVADGLKSARAYAGDAAGFAANAGVTVQQAADHAATALAHAGTALTHAGTASAHADTALAHAGDAAVSAAEAAAAAQQAITGAPTILPELLDVPAYSGQAGRVLAANAAEDGAEWIALPAPTGSFLALDDTPAAFTANRVPIVNGAGTALTFTDKVPAAAAADTATTAGTATTAATASTADSALSAGNATTAGGLAVSAGGNTEANRIARTDGGGNLPTRRVRQTASVYKASGVPARIYAGGNDGWTDFYSADSFAEAMRHTLRGRLFDVTTTTASLTLNPGTHYAVVCTNTAAITVTLPAPTARKTFVIKDGNGQTNVTIATAGAQLIDGAAEYTLTNPWQSVTVITDGANWFII
ncbi:hypothetical protein [Eilatimonas milleporae]|nr:hypothetical protein [Eilatimonas milleporae]